MVDGTARERKQVRLFVSSPSDVGDERERLLELIAALNRRYQDSVEITGIFWEEKTYSAGSTFQIQIDEPAESDLVICILWTRLGSPLPADWPPRTDGTPYETGTVYEFETALSAHRDKKTPDLYMFRKRLPEDDAALMDLMERHPAEKKRILKYLLERSGDNARAAMEMVERFWLRWFYSSDRGFVAAFNPFDTVDHFIELAGKTIETWLVDKGLVSRAVRWDVAARGSPYPGIEPFEPRHATVFFGREHVVDRALALWRGAAEAGFPWLLITGPSGSGKSSLMRAGILPPLTEDTPLALWRAVIVKPGGDDPLRSLIALFFEDGVLGPALAKGDHATLENLEDAARQAPAPFARSILAALDRAAEQARVESKRNSPPLARLALVIDQMEELAHVPAAQADALAAVLAALLREGKGRVWIAATLRSDKQEPLLAIAAMAPLLTLDAGGRELKLAAPAHFRDIVEKPAAQAGLSFETRAGDGYNLAEELIAAVAERADALPLLQMTLALLFERREDNVLSWAAYRAIGGLPGAIATRADEVMTRLPADAQQELGWLLRRLTRLRAEDEEVESRPASLKALTEGTAPRRALTLAMIDGRLLVADGDQLRVAHEALLRNWQAARDWAAGELELLRLHQRLDPLVRAWVVAGRPRDDQYLLLGDALLAAAESVFRQYDRDTLGNDMHDFIAAALAAAAARRTRRYRNLIYVAASLGVLAVLSLIGGVFAWYERGEARTALARAEANYQIALQGSGDMVDYVRTQVLTGAITATLAKTLLDFPAATLRGLETGGERDEILAVEAKMYDTLSKTYVVLAGQAANALDLANRAKPLAQRALSRRPADPVYIRVWTGSDTALADALVANGELDQALAADLDARDRMDALVQKIPGDAQIQRELGYVHQDVGDILRKKGDIAGAEAEFEKFLQTFETLLRRPNPNRDWLRGEALAHERLGDIQLERGDAAAAYPHFIAFTVVEFGLYSAAKDASRLTYETDLGRAYMRLGEVDFARKSYIEALAEYGRFQNALADAVAEDPSNAGWMRSLWTSHVKIGDVLLAEGQPAAAIVEYDAARDGYQALLKTDARPETRRDLAVVHQRLGRAHQAANDAAAARAEFTICAGTDVPDSFFDRELISPRHLIEDCRGRLGALK